MPGATAATQTVEPIDRGPRAIARTTVVDIPAEAIFARLSDPKRHP